MIKISGNEYYLGSILPDEGGTPLDIYMERDIDGHKHYRVISVSQDNNEKNPPQKRFLIPIKSMFGKEFSEQDEEDYTAILEEYEEENPYSQVGNRVSSTIAKVQIKGGTTIEDALKAALNRGITSSEVKTADNNTRKELSNNNEKRPIGG